MLLLNGFSSNGLLNAITLGMVITMGLFPPAVLSLTNWFELWTWSWEQGEGRALSQLCFPSTVNRLCPEDPDEQAAPAPVQPAAAAADVLPASSHGPPHDAKASQFNHESFQLRRHRCERNVSVSVWWDAATTPTKSTTPNERQKSRAFPREINVILH